MPWSVTADVERFDEALEWFQRRTVLSGTDAAALDADAKQRAFWVGGGLQLTQIQRVFDSLNVAIEKGEPFADWRNRVREDLTNDAHAETVFRNAAQRAYNAGRFRQMTEPSVAKFRPFWLYDSILDSRTTTICTARDGTLLPHDDPWWTGNIPPLHHRCRSSIRNLRKSEAERRGVTPEAPDLPPTPGWGRPPDQAPTWQPDPKKHDPALLAELGKKAEKKPREKKPKSAPPEHSPDHWLTEYSHLGDAAPCAAWGRACLARGLARPAKDVLSEAEKQRDAGNPAVTLEVMRSLREWAAKKTGPIGAGPMPPELKSTVAFIEHLRTIRPQSSFSAGSGGTAKHTEEVASAETFYRLATDASVKPPQALLHIDNVSGRSNYRYLADRSDGTIGERIELDPNARVDEAVHEIAHAIEAADPRALKASVALLRRRGGSGSAMQIRGYPAGEEAWEDEFWHAYVGKDYAFGLATEVTAMGYQRIVNQLEAFARPAHRAADEEMLLFLLGQLAGR